MIDADHCGSTAVIAIIRREEPHNILLVKIKKFHIIIKINNEK